MIRITKWLNPKQHTMHRGELITVKKWCEKECEDIQKRTGVRCVIKDDTIGHIAVYKMKRTNKKGKAYE